MFAYSKFEYEAKQNMFASSRRAGATRKITDKKRLIHLDARHYPTTYKGAAEGENAARKTR